LLPAFGDNGLAREKRLEVMVNALGVAMGKGVDFPTQGADRLQAV
jgi:hypothetical protein